MTLDQQTRMVSCPWEPTAEIDTSAWPEGFYHLVLTSPDARDHLIPLAVESRSLRDRVVIAFNDTTMQAYNRWGGYSLYGGPDHRFRNRAYKVSFDRPFQNFDEPDTHDTPLVRAAEALETKPCRLVTPLSTASQRIPACWPIAGQYCFRGIRSIGPCRCAGASRPPGTGAPTSCSSAPTVATGRLVWSPHH